MRQPIQKEKTQRKTATRKGDRKQRERQGMGGQERNGEKTLTFCFGHRLTNQPTDRPTNRPTDTAWSRVASPRLKIETLLVDIM